MPARAKKTSRSSATLVMAAELPPLAPDVDPEAEDAQTKVNDESTAREPMTAADLNPDFEFDDGPADTLSATARGPLRKTAGPAAAGKTMPASSIDRIISQVLNGTYKSAVSKPAALSTADASDGSGSDDGDCSVEDLDDEDELGSDSSSATDDSDVSEYEESD